MMKKIGAIAFAIMMIAMVANAWADLGSDAKKEGGTGSNPISSAGVQEGTYSNGTYGAIIPAKMTFKKDIVIFNGSSTGTKVFLPNITYQYDIAAAGSTAGDPEIIDEFGKKAVVYNGVLSTSKGSVISTTTDTIQFSNVNGIVDDIETTNDAIYVTSTKNGVVAQGAASFTFDPTKYLHAGIYRYIITESLASGSATRDAAGIYNTGYHVDRYLDVYVKNDKDNDNKDTFSIYGFVLFDANSVDKDWTAGSTDLSHKEDSTNAYAGKTNGFTSNITDGTQTGTQYDPAELNVDMYYTYNLNITKATTGDLADKTNEFPFAARITNTKITSGAKFSYKENGTVSTGTNDSSLTDVTMTSAGIGTIGTFNGDVAASDSAITLKDGENLYIYGIPSYVKYGSAIDTPVHASALVSEYNNTYDVYKVKIEYKDAVNSTKKKTDETWDGVVAGASMTTTATSATTYDGFKVNYEDPALIEFTNIMESVSPTGYVSRFAPYALILVGGIILLVIAMKRKGHKEEE